MQASWVEACSVPSGFAMLHEHHPRAPTWTSKFPNRKHRTSYTRGGSLHTQLRCTFSDSNFLREDQRQVLESARSGAAVHCAWRCKPEASVSAPAHFPGATSMYVSSFVVYSYIDVLVNCVAGAGTTYGSGEPVSERQALPWTSQAHSRTSTLLGAMFCVWAVWCRRYDSPDACLGRARLGSQHPSGAEAQREGMPIHRPSDFMHAHHREGQRSASARILAL